MYDRQTETWWQQATGEGIVGEFAGEHLKFIAAPVMSWKDVKENYPDGMVLSRNTGHRRPYGRNPYRGYDSGRGPIRSFFSGKIDKRLPAMERVVSLDAAGDGIAVPFSALRDRKVIDVRLGDREVAVFWAPGTASALDKGTISDGRDVGATAVFEKTLEGRELEFEPAGDGRFRDRETGSTWNIAGTAIDGPLEGKTLTPVQHGNHFWFAWGVFKPDTKIIMR